MMLYLIIVLNNLFIIRPENAVSLFEYFVMGGLFINAWIYLCHLIILFGDSVNSMFGRKRGYSDLNILRSFERTEGYSILHGAGLMLVLEVVLLVNYKYRWIAEESLIILILLIVNIINARLIGYGRQLPVKNNNFLNQGV